MVDTLGLLLAVVVTSAGAGPRSGRPGCGAGVQAHRRLVEGVVGRQRICRAMRARDRKGAQSTGAYRASQRTSPLGRRTANVVERRAPMVMPKKCWLMERPQAWLERNRRLVMHHDRKPLYAQAWVWLAQARMLLGQLK